MARAAYFELHAGYFGRPFDDGIVRALLAAGYDVDVYAPSGAGEQTLYGPRVRRLEVEYRRRWLQQHLRPSFARQYDLYLGTADLPMAFAGALATMARRPVVTACDEIFIGGYPGAARLFWKDAARWSMRHSAFTVITDLVRVPLQREYAGLGDGHRFFDYPSCYVSPYQGLGRDAVRARLGIGADERIISFTGIFTEGNGADWMIRQLDRLGDRTRLLVQTGGRPSSVLDALISRLDRVIYKPDRVSWSEAAELMNAADVALALYPSSVPEFANMGVSSQKLCTALWLDIPVVATVQPSFEFIPRYGCGELVAGEGELVGAIERVLSDRARYAANCARAVREYIRPAEKLAALTAAFANLRTG